MSQAKIEIRSKNVKNLPNIPSQGVPQHLFIIYTNSKGEEIILRGGTEYDNVFLDDLKIVNVEYTKQNENIHKDWVPDAPRSVIATGTDAEMQVLVDKMWGRAQEINNGKYDYKLPTPGCPPTLCHVQNSNTAVNEMVKAAGLELKLPKIKGKEIWVPGINGEIKHSNLDDIIEDTSEIFKEKLNDLNSLFDKFMQPEIINDKLTNSERLRLLANQEKEQHREEPGFYSIFDVIVEQHEEALAILDMELMGQG